MPSRAYRLPERWCGGTIGIFEVLFAWACGREQLEGPLSLTPLPVHPRPSPPSGRRRCGQEPGAFGRVARKGFAVPKTLLALAMPRTLLLSPGIACGSSGGDSLSLSLSLSLSISH